ncbi:uncharacterized protein EHS24_007636 [Apiotrichum porosum]|uniref:Uncharacterized protein n=1 Tax=Apiotrichum porosum TaxID=105984 RepID=A0A427XUY6_9TREE|nr:uncharacterized protein EHS24_007636 [Apiotrichum porosum]RSH82643.1 hypothetical protein EHS24_007636 [Apiotrichum porosum]
MGNCNHTPTDGLEALCHFLCQVDPYSLIDEVKVQGPSLLLGAETVIDDRATLLRDICTRIDAFTINLVALAEPKVPLAYAPDVSAMDAEFRKIDTVVVAYDSCLSLEAFEALWEDCAAVTRKMIADMTSASAKVESAAILEFIEGGVAVATTARTRLEPLQLEMKT